MNKKVLVVLIVIAAVIVVIPLFFLNNREEPRPLPAESEARSLEGRESSGLIIGANAIYVAEQAPSQTITVAVVRLEKSGFVVVHEDIAGVPGKILGKSVLLSAGETENPEPVLLSRQTRDGETLYAMLHLDDGDGIFDAVKDKPALDSVGALPVMMIVTVSTEATEPGAVSL